VPPRLAAHCQYTGHLYVATSQTDPPPRRRCVAVSSTRAPCRNTEEVEGEGARTRRAGTRFNCARAAPLGYFGGGSAAGLSGAVGPAGPVRAGSGACRAARAACAVRCAPAVDGTRATAARAGRAGGQRTAVEPEAREPVAPAGRPRRHARGVQMLLETRARRRSSALRSRRVRRRFCAPARPLRACRYGREGLTRRAKATCT
jgi:hypothetical protein